MKPLSISLPTVPYHCLFYTLWVCVCLCAQSCPTPCDPMDCSLLGSPLSIGFSRQEFWSELPFPTPGDIPDSRISCHLCISCIGRGSFTTEPPGKPTHFILQVIVNTNTHTHTHTHTHTQLFHASVLLFINHQLVHKYFLNTMACIVHCLSYQLGIAFSC